MKEKHELRVMVSSILRKTALNRNGVKFYMIKYILIKLIQFYKKFLSPLKGHPTCKFYPTCSDYAIEALKVHGVIVGSLLAVWRILRCNPFSKGGYDPVPDKRYHYIDGD